MKQKASFLKTSIKLITFQQDSSRKKGTGLKSIKLEMKKKGEVKNDSPEIQMILRNCYKQLYANKMENLEEMVKFLEKFNLTRPTRKKQKI